MTAYKFNHFEQTGAVKHGFSKRNGGVSTGCFSSLNLGFHRGDERENVVKNYEIFCGELGIDINNLVFASQTHAANVISVTKDDCGNGILYKNKFSGIDGLVTHEKHVAIVTFHADCVPLFFFDPSEKVIGLAHAGWRGTINKIAEKTINIMADKFGALSENILAGIGPSIGKCCFETDEPVYTLFESAGFAKAHVYNGNANKKHIDLWAVNTQIMIDCGVLPENIECMNICTKCGADGFFSHRNMNEQRGSHAAVMELL